MPFGILYSNCMFCPSPKKIYMFSPAQTRLGRVRFWLALLMEALRHKSWASFNNLCWDKPSQVIPRKYSELGQTAFHQLPILGGNFCQPHALNRHSGMSLRGPTTQSQNQRNMLCFGLWPNHLFVHIFKSPNCLHNN